MLVRLWRNHRIHGLQSPGPLISVFHTTSSFHSFVSSYTSSRSFPRFFPSVFYLSGTCWVCIFSLSLVFVLIIVLVWHLSSLDLDLFSFWWKINTLIKNFRNFIPGGRSAVSSPGGPSVKNMERRWMRLDEGRRGFKEREISSSFSLCVQREKGRNFSLSFSFWV